MSSRIASGVLVLSAFLSVGCAEDGKSAQPDPAALANIDDGSSTPTDPEADPEADPGTDPEADPQTAPDEDPQTAPDEDPQTAPDADPQTAPDTDPQTAPDADPQTSPDADPQTSPDADPQTSPDADPRTSPDADPQTAPDADPQTAPDTATGAASTAATGAATGAASTASSSKCTEAEGNAIIEAAYWANAGLTDAIGKTPMNDPGRWSTWFTATPTQSQQDHVSSILTDIRDRTIGSEIRCLKNPGTAEFDRCNQITVLAFVNLGEPVINLCPRFFDATGEWQINSLVHEAAHLSLNETDLKPTTDPSANNSVAQAIALAKEDPSVALRNASNFAHFVTNDPTM